MSDNESDEPIGRRGSSHRSKKSSSLVSKRKHSAAKAKAKRKIISSDEENMDESKSGNTKSVAELHRTTDAINLESILEIQRSSLSPILSKTLETPSFSPLLKGPPSPRHHNESLDWKHKVNLIGEKVVDPMIHICDKCQLPILIYARMIPCKHVFCLECGRAPEKICHKCGDKVTRVEQTTLGKVYMCNHQQGKAREPCKRTYLSQRDLQAHISHRHLKAKEKTAPSPSTPTATAVPAVPVAPVISQASARDPRQLHLISAASAGHPRTPTTGSSAVIPAPVPPISPSAAATSQYLNPPPVYAPHPAHSAHAPPQMVPPPAAVYPGGQYPAVPAAVHGSPYVHPTNAYGQAPPPPHAPFAPPPPPNAYEDYRGAPQAHWQQQRPPQRDYRNPQGYYRQ